MDPSHLSPLGGSRRSWPTTDGGCAPFGSPNSYLYASSNNFKARKGAVARIDVGKNYKKIRHLDAYGIGTHEIADQKDGTIVIANGGVVTHPDYGRTKLNLSTMKPSLVTIDAVSYKKITEVELPTESHQLSIRHLAIFPNSSQLVGLQYFGKSQIFHPVLAYGNASSLNLVQLPQEILPAMRNYCGSVACDTSGGFAAAASPKGGTVIFVERKGNECQYHHHFKMKDVCGILATKNHYEFLLSNGLGEVHLYNAKEKISKRYHLFPVKFDNHLS